MFSMSAGARRSARCRLDRCASLVFHRVHTHLQGEEERARARGWRVERGLWGTRTYWDPVFARLQVPVDAESSPAAEPACWGSVLSGSVGGRSL